MSDDYFNEWEDREVNVTVHFRVRTKRCEDYDTDHCAADADERVRDTVIELATMAPVPQKVSGPGYQVAWVKTISND